MRGAEEITAHGLLKRMVAAPCVTCSPSRRCRAASRWIAASERPTVSSRREARCGDAAATAARRLADEAPWLQAGAAGEAPRRPYAPSRPERVVFYAAISITVLTHARLCTVKPLLPTEDLCPTHTRLGVDPERQAESMRRLRELENRGRQAEYDRNDLLCALALSNSLSRPDMARSIGVSRSRVDQLIRDHYSLVLDRRAAAAITQFARHMP